jgi:hypothetical protein
MLLLIEWLDPRIVIELVPIDQEEAEGGVVDRILIASRADRPEMTK